MKTRTAATNPLPQDSDKPRIPRYEVTIKGVGTKTLPLPYAWAILFDSYTKGLHTVAYDEDGELFIELTPDRKFHGDSEDAIEFQNWASMMFKFFEGYVSVILGQPRAAPSPDTAQSQPGPAPAQTAQDTRADVRASEEAEQPAVQESRSPAQPQGQDHASRSGGRRGRR